MKRSSSQRSISTLASALLLGLFALCVLCVLLSGAGVYGRMVSNGQQAYSQRTSTQYLSTKVRQCPGVGCLAVEDFGGVPSLTFLEVVDGVPYTARVYCYDGWLMELFSPMDGDFSPEDGEKLLPAQSMSPQLADDVLQISLVDDYGKESSLTFSLRGGEEVAP